jgi:hypothetical protein
MGISKSSLTISPEMEEKEKIGNEEKGSYLKYDSRPKILKIQA